ncbi:UNVERIFIED_CONTAM: hypothetical protein Sindi_2959300 [Sesamum indicum]
MDGAEARDLYPGRRGKGQAPMSRRARRSPQNPGREPGRRRPSVADLGGSSKYSNENFEGRRGERFHVNGHLHMARSARAPKGNRVKIPEPGTRRLTATLGSPETSAGPREELSFLFNSLPTLETAQPEVGSSGWKSTARRVVSGAPPAALENPEDRVPSAPGPSGRWNNVGKGSRQNGSVTSGKGLALRAGHGGPSSEPVGCRRTARAAPAARAGRRVPAGDGLGTAPSGPSPGVEQPTQNWYGQGESDCLIKTKHCDGPCGCSRNVISAQCSECQSEEIQPSAGKRRE